MNQMVIEAAYAASCSARFTGLACKIAALAQEADADRWHREARWLHWYANTLRDRPEALVTFELRGCALALVVGEA